MHSARHEEYVSPLSARYASKSMQRLFSQKERAITFRKLWISLAKAEKNLGLSITHQQIAEMEDHVDQVDFSLIHHYEKKFRHDVMAHIHAFGDLCPKAKPILHLGATSAFVTDNADLILMKKAFELLFQKLLSLIDLLATVAEKEAGSICLGYTHFQPAQPTTIGKRISLWLQDFLWDAKDFKRIGDWIPFLGAKGATGTQSSFLSLFEGDEEKIKKLEESLQKDFGFSEALFLSGQTYTRKIDVTLFNALESFAASAHKMATDIRLLAHEEEIFEGFETEQVGSSAMPHKKNPIHAERICSLCRLIISLSSNPAYTLATQWLERSLDDSANRRICLSEGFLATDAVLSLCIHLIKHLKIDPIRAKKNLEHQLSDLCMENLLMLAVKKGGDRQKLHAKLKSLKGNPIASLLKTLDLTEEEAAMWINPERLIGRAKEQTLSFLKTEVKPFVLNFNIPQTDVTVDY